MHHDTLEHKLQNSVMLTKLQASTRHKEFFLAPSTSQTKHAVQQGKVC